MRIGFDRALVSLILENFIASLLLGFLTVSLIFLIGSEILINDREQLREGKLPSQTCVHHYRNQFIEE